LRVALDQFAARARITVSTASIGAYLRKQFGERPEPWLELDGRGQGSFDDVHLVTGSAPSHSWTEQPRGGEAYRHSSGSIPRMSGPITVLASNVAPDAALRDSRPPASDLATPGMVAPTDSKMGWESQRPALRGLTPAKVGLIAAPLIVILG